jgi:hypothetical protein
VTIDRFRAGTLRRSSVQFADPIGGDPDLNHVEIEIPALDAPAGDVRYKDVFVKVQLRLRQNHPSAGTSVAGIERGLDTTGQAKSGAPVPRPRSRPRIQLTVDQLADEILRQANQIVIRRALSHSGCHKVIVVTFAPS